MRQMIFKMKTSVKKFMKVLTAVYLIHAIGAVWKSITDQCVLQTLLIEWTFPKISLFATWKQKKKPFMIEAQLKMAATFNQTREKGKLQHDGMIPS